MATLTGMDRADRAIHKALRKALTGRVKTFVMRDLNQRLNAQEQPDGSAFPKKAESTIKAYKSKGWNTEKFLVRTGESTRLSSTVNQRGSTIELEIKPIGHEVLAFHVPSRVEWFPDYTQGAARDVIVNIMSEEVRSELAST